MLVSKRNNLRPLIESMNGVHLTAYLVNRGDLNDLKSQLRTTLQEAHGWLRDAMPVEERRKFLEPIETLLSDARLLEAMKGNIGIFRNAEAFRILNIPIEVDQSCQVATSFHVKPLLRWLQGDQEFLFLGLERNAAHLYVGSQDSFRLFESIGLPASFEGNEAPVWINDWISGLTKKSRPKLFLAGEPAHVRAVQRSLKYKNMVKTPIVDFFSDQDLAEACQAIRNIMKEESKNMLEKALLEFRFAEEGNRAKRNIFQISKAVVQGKVRKLIVTDELSIFGKIDLKSGGLAIHPFDLDHEDDCILDDLAQMVLSQGGEVVVAKRKEIPKGRPILAILDDDGEDLEITEDLHRENLQERFG